jgi:hypothetical protein
MEDGEISIAGLDKAELLAALYNAARTMSWGWLQASDGPMTKEQAQELIDKGKWHDVVESSSKKLYFDYVKGRPLKIDISGDVLRTRLYDRDQGDGVAAEVVEKLRGGKR